MLVPSSVFGKDAPSERLNLAVVGLGGQGGANYSAVRKHQNIVALCDVDDKRAGKAYEESPKAKKFYDFRTMFDEMESKIDAVVVSTPDHAHFHPAYWALTRKKHLYLEKPLAHSVWEIRTLCDLAAENKLATQLGAQRHALEGLRGGVEIVRSGVLGKITEVHSWIGTSRGMHDIPIEGGTPPESLKWDLWLGPVSAHHEYSAEYVPYNWRFWWDFGTGEAGNWGCHILDIPYWALDLKYPTRVEGSGPPPDAARTPKSMATRLDFPATDTRGPVALHWYQGMPPIVAKLIKENDLGKKANSCNNLFIGSEGMLFCGFDKNHVLLPEKKFAGHKVPRTFTPSPGFHEEWFEAIRGGKPATCNFGYSGPMAESVILANVAYRVKGKFNWDAKTLKPEDNPAAEKLIRPTFRKGWEVG
jgi:predicted dehydrogenase